MIIRNLELRDAYDCFPVWQPNSGGLGDWKTAYDTLWLNGATHVWVDHVTASDKGHPDEKEPTYFARNYLRHDGLLDITGGSDLVTVSWSRFADHDKAMLIGNGDTVTGDRGRLRVTLHHNEFESVVQRAPRVRFGQVHLYNNRYIVPEDAHDYRYSVGVSTESAIFAENNAFTTPGHIEVADLVKSWNGTALHATGTLFNGYPVDLLTVYNAYNSGSERDLTADVGWTPTLHTKIDSAVPLPPPLTTSPAGAPPPPCLRSFAGLRSRSPAPAAAPRLPPVRRFPLLLPPVLSPLPPPLLPPGLPSAAPPAPSSLPACALPPVLCLFPPAPPPLRFPLVVLVSRPPAPPSLPAAPWRRAAAPSGLPPRPPSPSACLPPGLPSPCCRPIGPTTPPACASPPQGVSRLTVAATLCAEDPDDPYVVVHGDSGRITFWYKQDRVLLQRADHGPEEYEYGRTDLLEYLVGHLTDGVDLLVPPDETGAFMKVVEAIRSAPDPAPLPANAWHLLPGEDHRVVPGVDGFVAASADSLAASSRSSVLRGSYRKR
ncbi:hypothetical protein SALBM311S_00224 [Streptomyces alboniger]